MDQQASGGEDPNKPSKKKSNEDESKNKKLLFSLLVQRPSVYPQST